jgi:hypothetical protein
MPTSFTEREAGRIGHGAIFCPTLRALICPSGGLAKKLSSPFCKNISLFPKPKSAVDLPLSRLGERGVSRSSTKRGAGCDGRRQRQARVSVLDEALVAYGEVVWSWRLDPGVKFAKTVSQAMVARTADHQGERAISRKTMAQGVPGVSGVPVYSCAFYHCLCTRGRGCGGHPALPCALVPSRAA